MPASPPRAVIAEDEPIIRMDAADMLRGFGFEVLEAEHADAALVHMEACDDVVLLYTDVQMPGGDRDGFGLAHEVARRWPAVAIIVCSGCMPPQSTEMPEGAHFIGKPCAERLVRRALDKLGSMHLNVAALSAEPPERHFFKSLARHRLLWPFMAGLVLFLIAAALRLADWVGWWP